MDTEELFNFGVTLMKAQAGQFEERAGELLECGCIEECMCEGDPDDFCDN